MIQPHHDTSLRFPREPRSLVSVVVPLLDEQETLPELHRRLTQALDQLHERSEIIYVDDGSSDATPDLLEQLSRDDERVAVLRLSRNFGHQAAVSAGLDHAHGHGVVVMDGDLQDPPELIPALVERWREGFEVVFAIRRARREAWPLRACYAAFYRLQRRLGGLELPLDSGDFGMMDRRVVDAIRSLPERARFIRGLRAFVGFRQTGLEYERDPRAAGRPKYTLRKLVGLGIDGLVSFSAAPLRLVTWLGLASAGVALALAGWAVADAFSHHTAPRGWASLIIVVLFMGAVQLISLGIIGEYVRLIFVETKGRPTYIVDSSRPASLTPRAGAARPTPRRAVGMP